MMQFLARQFTAGGSFMWAILAVLALAFAVFVERVIFYFVVCRRSASQLIATIAKALNDNRLDEALSAVGKSSSPMSVLLRTVLEGYRDGMPSSLIQESVEERAISEVPRLTNRLNYISLFANAATLIGLLGTISGLMKSFASLATVEASKKAALLANGISEAMITTAFGLIVAIPCMFAHTFLLNVGMRRSRELDEAVVKLMNYLKKKRP